jgi:HTH-type transcriptional regulator / antitoxin HipB
MEPSRNCRVGGLSRLSTKSVLYCLHDKTVLLSLSDMKDYAIKTPQQLGAVLEGYRKNCGLTQKAVGSKVGLAQSVVSLLEKTPQRAGLARIFKLLAALDLEIVVRPRGTSARKSDW